MSAKERTSKVLKLLIPTGVIGISSALASIQAQAEPAELTTATAPVAERLSEIRSAVSTVNKSVINNATGAKLILADWLNFGGGIGWHNGGWGNGGWGNGGWHNWGNGGWGNGGWHNWNNGWHNWGNGGWHNFWHNW